jgi:hypothetical protein
MFQMYCPKCASQAVPGQRFCKNCGTNLGVILDAMEGKRGPLDFESLKRDLRDLGSSLRSGFEEARASIKGTQKLSPPSTAQPPQVVMPNFSREVEKALRKVKAAHTRKYSLQQATLSIFGGGAWIAVWYQLLEAAANSGLLQSLELIILDKAEVSVVGLVPVFRLLWMLGLIPIARGIAHLINGIFFPPPKPEKEAEAQTGFTQNYVQPTPAYVSAVSGATTGELGREQGPQQQSSITEDATLRFEPKF